ncbi:FHA domain-containing protein [Agromyces sp. SYSU K20354]|uniref:FHA domain-containing protein n=1 Tax=Agromyces cavernae TaxID=2898659 RepID=UPI001E55B7DB|nr:FHA domain-containing protein [Agromyces cavernae]MCD2444332.1 FHA domain-containing protein [Agromyces cavernae]
MTEHVSDWPRVSAVVHPDATGELTTNGISRACAAESIDALRVGMIADVAALAATMRRPVRMDVVEGPANWRLAVRPNGVVHEVAADGTIPPTDGLLVQQGYCRACRQPQPVTATSCGACGAEAPLRVVVAPHTVHVAQVPVLGGQAITAAAIVAEASTELPVAPPRLRAPLAQLETVAIAPGLTPREAIKAQAAARIVPIQPLPTPIRDAAPRLRVRVGEDQERIVPASIALGRNPRVEDERTPVVIESPEQTLSRTHALVDVDEAGQIVVTDNNAANGVIIQGTGAALEPGTPTVIAEGEALLMGDVTLTIEIAA